MTGTLTQEALLDLIAAYADAYLRAGFANARGDSSTPSRERDVSEAHRAVIRAVRSLPIEAGR